MKKTPGKIAIFGQYKTGTTALFTKLRNSLPADTRTLFEPLDYTPEAEDAGRWVLAKTILKFPGHPEPVNYDSFLPFDRKLYLIRDPRDWLVSATLFLTQEKVSIYTDDRASGWVMDYLHRKEQAPRTLPLKVLLEYILSAPPAIDLEHFARRTRSLHEWCIQFENRLRRELFSIRYEDFIDGRLAALEDYLEIPLPGHTEVDEAYDHVPRTRSYGNWKNWLLEEDARLFKPFFDPYIRHYGYSQDWRPNDQPVIESQYGSHYVARVMQRKKARLPPG